MAAGSAALRRRPPRYVQGVRPGSACAMTSISPCWGADPRVRRAPSKRHGGGSPRCSSTRSSRERTGRAARGSCPAASMRCASWVWRRSSCAAGRSRACATWCGARPRWTWTCRAPGCRSSARSSPPPSTQRCARVRSSRAWARRGRRSRRATASRWRRRAKDGSGCARWCSPTARAGARPPGSARDGPSAVPPRASGCARGSPSVLCWSASPSTWGGAARST